MGGRQDPAQGREEPARVSWGELAPTAASAFFIWTDQPELQWAERAWEFLNRAGLASYRNRRERYEVILRFLALAGIYYDFCHVAWDEPTDPDYREWADDLGLGAFEIGLLFGARLELSQNVLEQKDQELDTEEEVGAALEELVDAARSEVSLALRDGLGGVSMLFASLWRSRQPSSDDEADTDASENDFDALNDVTSDKARAFEWLESACLQTRDLSADSLTLPPPNPSTQDEQTPSLLYPAAVAEEYGGLPDPADPRLLLIANPDGSLKPEFKDWEDLLPLEPGRLMPLWWPEEADGYQMSPQERLGDFAMTLNAYLESNAPPSPSSSASRPASDSASPTPASSMPQAVLRCLLLLRSVMLQE